MSNVSKIGLGCDRLGSFSGIGGSEAESLLNKAYEEGIKFYDTANIYGQGQSEVLLGALKNRVGDIKIGTKGGYKGTSSGIANTGGLKSMLRPLLKRFKLLKTILLSMRSKVVNGQDFSGAAILSAARESVGRLNCEKMDLYMLHSPSTEVLSSPVLQEIMEQLKSEGLASECGVALADVSHLSSIASFDGIDHIQLELNLLNSAADFKLVEGVKRDHSLDIVVRRPYSGGDLLGKGDSPSDRVKLLTQVSEEANISLDQMCLAYMLQCPFVDRVLVGTTKLANLQRNVETAKTVELSDVLVSKIKQVIEN